MSQQTPPIAPPPGSPFARLLGALAPEAVEALLAGSEVERVLPGAVIVDGGARVSSLEVVLEGHFRVEAHDRHHLASELATLGPGDYFGEMSFLRGERATASVCALGPGTLLRIGHETLAEVAAWEPALIREMAGTAALRLSASAERARALRPGRALVVVAEGAWAHLAALRTAESAAWHGRAPVVFIECHAGQAIELPGAEAIPASPDQAESMLASVRGRSPRLLHADASQLSRLDVLRLVEAVRPRSVLVVVCAGQWTYPELDGPFHFADGTWPGAGEGTTTIRLEGPPRPPLPSLLRALAAGSGNEVVALFGGGMDALARREWPATSEPWLSVDHVARRWLRRTIGLALGAGGAKGFAHIGALRALRRLGVPVDFLAGCSIGGPLAAGVAIGMGPRLLKRELDMTFARAMRPVLPVRSFLSTRRLIGEMDRLANGRSWDDLLLPLALVATDIETREEVVLTAGPAAESMAASMAIPGIFSPVTIDGRRLVDGGIVNPVPAATAAALGADVVIGVKLADPPRPGKRPRPRRFSPGLPPIVELITSAIDVMQWKITSDGAAGCDVTIAPVFATPIGLRDFRRGDEIMAAGEAATLAAAPELARLLPWVPPIPPGEPLTP